MGGDVGRWMKTDYVTFISVLVAAQRSFTQQHKVSSCYSPGGGDGGVGRWMKTDYECDLCLSLGCSPEILHTAKQGE